MEKTIVDHKTLKRTLRRLSYEIIEKSKTLDNIVLLGIQSKGLPIATIIQENIKQLEGKTLPVFPLDISPYRDDKVSTVSASINKEYVTTDIKGKTIILVDDVLYTGRTIRAAMDAVMDLGRPDVIQLCILIDRGHRQLPIRANYIGKNIPTSSDESIRVTITDLGEDDKVEIIS
jgi:pyrimidine operon attenuation protein/uracil phosphoribosyltransferase